MFRDNLKPLINLKSLADRLGNRCCRGGSQAYHPLSLHLRHKPRHLEVVGSESMSPLVGYSLAKTPSIYLSLG